MNRVFIGEITGLTGGREFFDDQANIVFAMSVRRGGASASGVNKSDMDETVKVALGMPGEVVKNEGDAPVSSFSRTTSIKQRFL